MSQLAEAMRDRRRHWAARGSRLDVIVRVLQLGLPIAVGALVAVLLVAPFSHRSEVSFLLDKREIQVAPDRLRVQRATYSGFDSQGRAFSVIAQNAVQRSAADPIVRMQDLDARIEMADGPATLTAHEGRYNPTDESIAVDGSLLFRTADGYRINANHVTIDMKARRLTSFAAVSGALPIGTFRANRLSADLEQRMVRLEGNVRLRINQGALN